MEGQATNHRGFLVQGIDDDELPEGLMCDVCGSRRGFVEELWQHPTRVSMEVIVTILSKLVYFTYLWDEKQPTFIGVIIYLISASRTSQ